MDAFTKFDEFDMKLKNLTIKSYDDNNLFLEVLAQSNQARYIQNPNLQNILHWPITKLNDMTALKTLDIGCEDSNDNPEYRDKKIIDFNQLVEACPVTFSWLSTNSVDFGFNKSTSKLTSITYLNLRHVELTRALVNTLEASFPRPLTLKLHCELSSDLTISLPNHNLQQVDIGIIYEGERHIGFSTKTTNDDNVQYHATESQIHRDLVGSYPVDRVIPVSEDDFNGLLVLTFIRGSAPKFSRHTSKKNVYIFNE